MEKQRRQQQAENVMPSAITVARTGGAPQL
jgi:hypothetical protein